VVWCVSKCERGFYCTVLYVLYIDRGDVTTTYQLLSPRLLASLLVLHSVLCEARSYCTRMYCMFAGLVKGVHILSVSKIDR